MQFMSMIFVRVNKFFFYRSCLIWIQVPRNYKWYDITILMFFPFINIAGLLLER